MSTALTAARKELRALFHSPVALIFLAIFLLTTLSGVFTWKAFFVRGLADLRPLFELLPMLLIFLVAAITIVQGDRDGGDEDDRDDMRRGA